MEKLEFKKHQFGKYPTKRMLTDEEMKFLRNEFKFHGIFKYVDANGNILLNDGHVNSPAKYYITETMLLEAIK